MPETRGQRGERYAWLGEALSGDGAVLTASRRLARELHASFAEQQRAAGVSAWATPAIAFWRDWARELLVQTAGTGSARPISANASFVLWEACLRRHIDGGVFGVNSLTRQAVSAWQRLIEWRIPIERVAAAAGSHDERVFARSAQHYERQLTDRGWIDPSQVPAVAIERLRDGLGRVPERVCLAGFDRMSPLSAALLEVLEQRGCSTSVSSENPPADAISTQSFVDVDAELRAAGRWARETLRTDPSASIAVVSTDLESEATRYARLIREGLAPGWQIAGDEHRNSVNVSFGRRLADFPAVSVALLCLRWVSRGLTSREVSVLLRSPFLGGDTPGDRARQELRLRDLPDRRWSAAALADALGGDGEPTTGEWMRCVRRIAELQLHATARQAPSAWAERMDTLLVSLGWPGADSLQSDEFQLINRWRELLNELAAMDVVLPETSISEAIARLSQLAGDAVYQPELGPGRVALLGALEAAGMEFDYLWVVGMDAGRWPAASHPLSLVSRRLQLERGMPDAAPADTLDYSRRVAARLAGSANRVCFSWARTQGDSTQMPSPLLETLQKTVDAGSVDPGWHAGGMLGQAGVCLVAEDPLPNVRGVERLAGGAGLIDLHRHEPFSAFAHGRLGVRELERFQAGLSASLRGNILHEALFELLRDTPSQQTMAEWSGNDRRRRIDRSIGRALRRPQRHADSVLHRLFALERLRLRVVMDDFLHAEIGREPFQIDRVEEKIRFEHAGVELSLRADRIDRLADGSLLIIDYKTGTPKKLLGKDGEPVDTQVVVYAAARREAVGGLALVNVSRRSIEYKAVGGSVHWGNVSADEWPAMLRGWKKQVLDAIEAIAGGDVRIRLHPGAARRRQLDVLSRIEEERRVR